MENKQKIGLAAVGILGCLCVALDIVAEFSKVKLAYRGKNCVVISGSFAPYYEAAFAVAILGIAQIIIDTQTGRWEFTQKSPHPRSAAHIFMGHLSFWTYIGALIYYLLVNLYNFAYNCTVPRRGTWAVAAILSLANVTIGMAYTYYHLLSAKNSNAPQIEIAMGQTNPSTVTQDPVFVHEDTFMRRQFP